MGHKDPQKQAAYQREYKKTRREYLTEYAREWRKTPAGKAAMKRNADKVRNDPDRKRKAAEQSAKAGKVRRSKDKLALISFYGGKCVHCGFNDPRALQIDHINGGGRKELQSIPRQTYYSLDYHKANKKKYQLLCANCNQIKRMECSEHSHSKRTC